MIISHRHRFIFVRVPKTASTSVQIAFGAFCGEDDIVTPLSTRNDHEITDADLPAAQNTTVSRWRYAPGDWVRLLLAGQAAEYDQHITARRIRQYLGRKSWNAYFKFCVVRNPFDRAVSLYRWQERKSTTQAVLNDYILQLPDEKLSSWHRYTIRNRIVMDHICRYEQLQHELDDVAKRLGIQLLSVPHAKAGTYDHTQSYQLLINPAARQRIEQICRRELDAFGYSWEGAQE
ncbi:MAG: sulfotransferase family 2 domain-containing protein [Anaerolineae bacterium]|nr:sulfotransferase family 2 domain-containing protein [Anaerolineae bacterium]